MSQELEQANSLIKQTMKEGIYAKDFSIEEMRAIFNEMKKQYAPQAQIEVVDADGVECRWLAKENFNSKRVVFYLHGGCYFFGNGVDAQINGTIQIAESLKAKTFSVNYSKSPEHPFPAALNDAMIAYQYLLKHGHDPQNIVFLGDSSGGNLVMVLLLALRKNNLPMPRAACIISAWLDFTFSGESYDKNEEADIWCTKKIMQRSRKWFVGDQDPKNPMISPVFAELSGLPPIYVSVGSNELIVDESKLLAKKLKEAGNDVTLEVGEGLFHDYPLILGMVPECDQANERIAHWLDRQFTR